MPFRNNFKELLGKGVKPTFQGTCWIRHPKALQVEMKEDLRRLYEAVDLKSAKSVRDHIIATYESKAPRATSLLDEAFDDITAVLIMPLKYRKRLRTTNGAERLNQEIRRRERVIRIFPNEESVIRLMGALLMEQSEKWQTGRKYFEMDLYYQDMKKDSKRYGCCLESHLFHGPG
jgi:putative transposase